MSYQSWQQTLTTAQVDGAAWTVTSPTSANRVTTAADLPAWTVVPPGNATWN